MLAGRWPTSSIWERLGKLGYNRQSPGNDWVSLRTTKMNVVFYTFCLMLRSLVRFVLDRCFM